MRVTALFDALSLPLTTDNVMHHRLSFLVNADELPHHERTRFKKHRMAAAMINMQQQACLAGIHDVFSKVQLPFVVLKGVVLSQLLYGTPSQRQMCDIDILVAPNDLKQAVVCLKQLGFVNVFPNENLTPSQKNYVMYYEKDHVFFHPEKHLCVELHWKALTHGHLCHLDAKTLFEHTQVISIEQRDYQIMNNELLLVYLVVHGSYHFYGRLQWLCDVVQCLESLSLDQNSVLWWVGQLGVERMLAMTLNLILDLSLIDSKKISMQTLLQKQKKCRVLVNQLKHLIKKQASFDRPHVRYFYRLCGVHALHLYWKKYVRISRHDFSWCSLPRGLFFIYYIHRVFRVMQRWSKARIC